MRQQPDLPGPAADVPWPPPSGDWSPAPQGGAPIRRIAIVDDQPIPRTGLEHLAATIPGMRVVASVASVDDLDSDPDATAALDVVLLHLPMYDDGQSLRAIAHVAEHSHPLVISAWDRAPSLMSAVRAGARGCVTRQSTHRSVAAALDVVAGGGFYLCDTIVDRFQLELSRPPSSDPHGLAPREAETLRWIARGLTHSEIAHRMGLTPATINTYAKRIRSKLKVTSRSELTRIAIDLGEPVSSRSGSPG